MSVSDLPKVTITWKVDDGFVNNGTHTLKIDKEEWDDMNAEEKDAYIYEMAMQNITISWKEKT